jgi:phosphoglycerate kinase
VDKLTLKDIPLKGKRVLMRVDFNVPLNKDGSIADDSRIKAALPSIRYVLSHGGSLVLMSHLGRPKGVDPTLSLKVCADRLSELLGEPVAFGDESGKVRLLENLRFHPEEEKPTESFVVGLAKLGDVYVNDAFGTAHRKHASTYEIAKYFPGKAVAGFLMEKEVEALGTLLKNPKRPFYAVLGGAKISSKIGLVEALLDKVDGLFLGGAMAFTFLKAKGWEIGKSLFEPEFVEKAKGMLSNPKIHLPTDVMGDDGKIYAGNVSGQGMDVGPKTIEEWGKALGRATTVFWNGPLGVFEKAGFEKGTKEMAELLARSGAKVIVGGGDSVAAIQQMGLGDKFYHLSTGGGAALEFLEYGHLPGIDALSSKIIDK